VVIGFRIIFTAGVSDLKSVRKMNDETTGAERIKFETKWNCFNNIRTGISFSVSLILLSIVIMG